MEWKKKRTRNEETSSLRIKIKSQNLRERGEASSNFLKLGFDSVSNRGPLELWLTAGRDQLSGLANKSPSCSRSFAVLKPDIGSRSWQTNLLAVKFYRYYHCYYYNRVERTRPGSRLPLCSRFDRKVICHFSILLVLFDYCYLSIFIISSPFLPLRSIRYSSRMQWYLNFVAIVKHFLKTLLGFKQIIVFERGAQWFSTCESRSFSDFVQGFSILWRL